MSAHKLVASPGRRVATGDVSRPLPTRLRRLREWMSRAWRNHRTRRYLTEMDDHMLSDLGISRAQAAFEASRRMWD